MATFSEIIEILTHLYGDGAASLQTGVDPEQIASAMKSRVQNLQKMGIPLGMNVGKGKRINYSRNEAYQIFLCIELANLGIAPSISTQIIKQHWDKRLKAKFETEWKTFLNPAVDGGILLFFFPEIMKHQDEIIIGTASLKQFSEGLGKLFPGEWKSMAVVSISNLVRRIEWKFHVTLELS